MKSKRMTEKLKSEILGTYAMFDDDYVSTETLLCMVADACGCDTDTVVEALIMEDE